MNKLLDLFNAVIWALVQAMFCRTSGLLCASGLLAILIIGIFKIPVPLSLYVMMGWGLISFYVAVATLCLAGGHSVKVRTLMSKL